MNLPDVSKNQQPKHLSPINWVGMEKIALPIQLNQQTLFAHADIHINLPQANAKGIHMSRVFLQLQQLKSISPEQIRNQLTQIIATHANENTNQARLTLTFQLPIQHQALKTSQINGWKYYPITIYAQLKKQEFQLSHHIDIEYSSTCPCSAALSRQIIANQFASDFATSAHLDKDQAILWIQQNASLATPHSQRSTAHIEIETNHNTIDLKHIILSIEGTLKTATQTAVKRADEQAFAQRNGENLMFVEDAIRRIGHQLKGKYSSWQAKVTHYESLHSHNAVAYLDHTLMDQHHKK